MKIGLDGIDVFVFNAVRLTVSTLVLGACAYWQFRRGVRPRPGVTAVQLMLYGLAISVFYQFFFLLGVSRTTSGAAGLIFATVPLWTALMARAFTGERLTRGAWTGLLIALTGTAIVTGASGGVVAGARMLLGNFIMLLAAITWAGGTVYGRSLLQHISPLQLSACAAAIALPVHWIAALGRYGEAAPALRSSSLVLIILYSGVLSSGLALPMWNLGVRHAGAAHAAIIQNLVPLIALASAWPLRGEAPTAAQLAGGALILSGLVVMRRNR